MLAENFDAGVGGRQPPGQNEQLPGGGTADGDVGFAVAAGDRDAGRCPGDQPLAGIGQPRVGGVKMQALAVSAQVLCPGRIRGAPGAGGDESEPLVDAVCGDLRGQIDVPTRRELSVRQVDSRFVGPAARPEAGRADAGQRPRTLLGLLSVRVRRT